MPEHKIQSFGAVFLYKKLSTYYYVLKKRKVYEKDFQQTMPDVFRLSDMICCYYEVYRRNVNTAISGV